MLNEIVLVGRLTNDVEIKTLESGNKVSNITLAVPRNFKNSEGIYETDFIPIEIWNTIAENAFEYLKTGDMVGVKGRLQADHYKNEENKNMTKIKVIASKITFLSTRKQEKDTIKEEI